MNRAIVISIVLSLTSYRAHAADDKAAADSLIAKGLELRRQGRALDAIELFQKALAIAPSPRTYGQLGLAESGVERWSEGEEDLNSALSVPQDPWVKKNHAALEQALNVDRTHIGQIALTGPAGAAVIVSGRALGNLPLTKTIRVNAGSALVTATAPGFRQFEMSVPVEVGKETQLKIVLEPLEVPAAPLPAPRSAPLEPLAAVATPPQQIQPASSWRSWTGTALLVAGGGLSAWGIVWIALDGHHSSGSCSLGSQPGCVPLYNTETGGIVLTSVGAAAAIGGGILLYTAKSHNADVRAAVGPSSLFLAGRF